VTAALHLTIATPTKVLAESTRVRSLRAMDASGSFGILPGHADLLTVLPASVVQWCEEGDETWHFCAVRAGVFSVSGGHQVAIACRRGVLGTDLRALEAEIHETHEAETEAERHARVEQTRFHAMAVRELVRYLLPQSQTRRFPALPESDMP
jgi:F-type H+-transporting ATPase subunit epsilon